MTILVHTLFTHQKQHNGIGIENSPSDAIIHQTWRHRLIICLDQCSVPHQIKDSFDLQQFIDFFLEPWRHVIENQRYVLMINKYIDRIRNYCNKMSCHFNDHQRDNMAAPNYKKIELRKSIK